MCKIPHYVRDVNQPFSVSSDICLVRVQTMHPIVAYFTHTLLTYVRYGQVIGQCVNAPIHTFGIVHNFTKKRERNKHHQCRLSSTEWLWDESKASLHFHILVLFPSLLCFSIILFFLLLMCLPLLPTLLHHSPMSLLSPHLSVILISFFLSLDGTTESRPPKLMTIIILWNVAAGLALSPAALSLILLLPLSSSLSFSCPSPKVAISHAFPACST